jgi:hypothetical protein
MTSLLLYLYWHWSDSERNIVAPWGWHCFAETCRGHRKNKINKYRIQWILLIILYIFENARYKNRKSITYSYHRPFNNQISGLMRNFTWPLLYFDRCLGALWQETYYTLSEVLFSELLKTSPAAKLLSLIVTCSGYPCRLSCITPRVSALPLSYSTYGLTVLGQAVNHNRKEKHKKVQGKSGRSLKRSQLEI